VQVAAGHAFNLVLTREGKIFTWGRNEQGQVRTMGGRRGGRVELDKIIKEDYF